MTDDNYTGGKYRAEIKETEAGPFVEIWDSEYSNESPVAFMPLDSAVDMANSVQKAKTRYIVSATDQ